MIAAPQRIALAPVRARIWLVALLLVLAGIGWWWTIGEMQGMDAGPWTGLGTLGWFLGVWLVMMAAMMLPSAAADGDALLATHSASALRRLPSRPDTCSRGEPSACVAFFGAAASAER